MFGRELVFRNIVSVLYFVYSWFSRLLEGPGFFLENFRTWKVLENNFGPGKSWKNILENDAFLIGSDGEQVATVYHPVCVDCCLLKYCIQQFRIFFCSLCLLKYLLFRYILTLVGYETVLENLSWGSWISSGFFVSKRV